MGHARRRTDPIDDRSEADRILSED